MLSTAQSFMDACTRQDWQWLDARDLESGKSLVVCGINGDDTNYTVQIFFDEDEESVAFRTFGLTRVTEETQAAMICTCNDLNNRFRWVKFCVDSDLDVNVEIDAVITPETSGDVCVELLCRIAGIVDRAYPQLMKAQFGG